ncbi:MAG TPA: hypothetical protein PKA00_14600, partial [Saprospiraceae bacterium]|nr:hypothetical protein [Saprospiraceae bacterium]HMQ84140.1 hypothetical protein [Saprospiraceae bacterium]
PKTCFKYGIALITPFVKELFILWQSACQNYKQLKIILLKNNASRFRKQYVRKCTTLCPIMDNMFVVLSNKFLNLTRNFCPHT